MIIPHISPYSMITLDYPNGLSKHHGLIPCNMCTAEDVGGDPLANEKDGKIMGTC